MLVSVRDVFERLWPLTGPLVHPVSNNGVSKSRPAAKDVTMRANVFTVTTNHGLVPRFTERTVASETLRVPNNLRWICDNRFWMPMAGSAFVAVRILKNFCNWIMLTITVLRNDVILTGRVNTTNYGGGDFRLRVTKCSVLTVIGPSV